MSSFSPKHTTSFSVTDILNPIEDSYKKTTIEATIPPLLSPYRAASNQIPPPPLSTATSTAMNSLHGSMNGSTNAMASAYYNMAAQLSSHPAAASAYAATGYCGSGSESAWDSAMAASAAQRNSTNAWYGANATDPRIASKLKWDFVFSCFRVYD